MKRTVIHICILLFTLPHTTVQAQEFERSVELKIFIPGGQWILRDFISYSEHSESNYNFPIIKGISSSEYTFKAGPMLCYAFKDNLVAGGHFSYARTLTRLSGVTISAGGDNQLDLDGMYRLECSYAATAMMRNYVSLGNSKRSELYCGIQLRMGGSQSEVASDTGEDATGAYSTSTDLNTGVAPGMVALISSYTAVEVGVNILGLDPGKTRQTTNQVYMSKCSPNSASFRISLFSIGLGIAFYL